MKLKPVLLPIICIIIIFLAIALAAHVSLAGRRSPGENAPGDYKAVPRATLNYTEEQLAGLDYFDLFFPADENIQLPSDVYSLSYGDGVIYMFVPEAENKTYSYYVRDKEGQLLQRFTSDFSETVTLCGYEIVLYRPALRTMYLNTESNDRFEAMIHEKEHNSLLNVVCHFGSIHAPARLQGRGNTSWTDAEKKSFSLRFNERMPLFEDATHKSYNLIANAFDRSLLKNLMFNKLARDVGIPYQPEEELIILLVDGKYHGIYTLTTKMTVDSKRIALEAEDMLFQFDPAVGEASQDEGEALIPYTSKYWNGDPFINEGAFFELLYPEDADEETRALAEERVQAMIDAIEDTESDAYLDYIDLDNLARFYLIQEISMNYDAHHRSIYAFYRNGRIYYGPVWDMDLTLGKEFEKYGMEWTEPEGFYVNQAGIYKALFEHPDFVARVKELYENELREKSYAALAYAREEEARIAKDAEFNFREYPQEYKAGIMDYSGDTYNYIDFTDNMFTFFEMRLNWLDQAIPKL
ncbi:MAG: CotH kinase family protein [Lachnospiraceae bacterium]|nr:CotH kinase family protein [Lachnospiraceae bacterium]